MKFVYNRTYLIVGTLILLVLLSVGFFIYTQKPAPLPQDEQSDSTSTIDLSKIATTTQVGDYRIEPIPTTVALPTPPSLNRPVPETPGMDAQVRATIILKLSEIVATLKTDSSSFDAWLTLGTLRQALGDYVGAAEAWVYATKLSPHTGVAYANLGNLYANYTKDYPKAEASYLKGIQNDPQAVNTYRNLFELYVYSYKTDTSAAEDLLKTGIAKLPKALDLKVLLARYYRDKGRVADARVAYDNAITAATTAGNAALATELTSERDALQ